MLIRAEINIKNCCISMNEQFVYSGEVNLTENGPDAQHPIIRTLYDHIDVYISHFFKYKFLLKQTY